MKRRLVAALACRNQGSRLYGKPVQNLDIENGVKIIDHIIACLKSIQCIDEIILGISTGIENEIFIKIAEEKQIKYVIGDENDVLSRLISCGDLAHASDIFRVTSESPFLFFDPVEQAWIDHVNKNLDATFMDDVIDGSGFEIIALDALKTSHINGSTKHRSELCTLYIRENISKFKIKKLNPDKSLIRKDLRLTVDNPEDLVVCRELYLAHKDQAPRISVHQLVVYLDAKPKLKELIAPFSELGYSSMYL
jgi:spore coat polysaccharide biosynthesis protein SpsF